MLLIVCCLIWSSKQIENSYNDFEGKTVIDLGCGTVRVHAACNHGGATNVSASLISKTSIALE